MLLFLAEHGNLVSLYFLLFVHTLFIPEKQQSNYSLYEKIDRSKSPGAFFCFIDCS